jgi:hypothetical protein
VKRRYTSQIAALDAKQDCQEIVFLLTCYEFPWDIERALEFALFRTFAVPSISGLLNETGEFLNRPRKRYDDTELILAEILENGFDSARGRAAFTRMNQMHGRFSIANEDLLYVLSTFVFEPIRWIDRFGWRTLTEHEKLACFHYFRELGRRMHIRDIPKEMPELERYNRDYEARRFRYAETNERIASVTRDVLLGFYLPRLLIPVGRPIVHTLLDAPLAEAMGFSQPSTALRRIARGALKLRARIAKQLPDRQRPHLLTRVKRATYPEGYKIRELGTFPE